VAAHKFEVRFSDNELQMVVVEVHNGYDHTVPRSEPQARRRSCTSLYCRRGSERPTCWIKDPSVPSLARGFGRDGALLYGQDYRGLNAIMQRSVEPPPHARWTSWWMRPVERTSSLSSTSPPRTGRAVSDPAGGPVQDILPALPHAGGGQYEFRFSAFCLHFMS
jgi:hypothetical protein